MEKTWDHLPEKERRAFLAELKAIVATRTRQIGTRVQAIGELLSRAGTFSGGDCHNVGIRFAALVEEVRRLEPALHEWNLRLCGMGGSPYRRPPARGPV